MTVVRRFSLGLATVVAATAVAVSCSETDGDANQRAAATDSAVSPNVAARARREPLDHVLFAGPPGLGLEQ